jgi:hypothetical protein
MSKKRKVSLMKPSSWKNSKDSNPKREIVLTMDDINVIITVISYTSKDIIQCNEANKETMYARNESKLRGEQ